MRNLYFFLGALLLVDGVFGVEKVVGTLSVFEGDSVTLNPHLTEIPGDVSAEWWFRKSRIAQSNKNVFDERFRDRLKLDEKTGSLTITNTRTTDSGLYTLKITDEAGTSRNFSVTVSEINIMSVVEGDSVTLQTDTKIQKDDQILWMYESTCIAEINRTVSEFSLYEDVLDGRFRGRLKLDEKTGSLNITNTRTNDSGVYKLQTSNISKATKYKRFVVTVSEIRGYSILEKCLGGIVVLLVVIQIIICIYCRRRRRRQLQYQNPPPGLNLNQTPEML